MSHINTITLQNTVKGAKHEASKRPMVKVAWVSKQVLLVMNRDIEYLRKIPPRSDIEPGP